MSIDPRHLANLLAVAEHGSFNRAAAARGISQPALSHSIAQLERRLGCTVIDRSRRGSQVNEYGRILLQGAQGVEALLAQTAERVRLRRLGVEGPLRVGATPSMSWKFLPDLMARLLRSEERVQITLSEALDDELLPALQLGSLDVVFGPAFGDALPADLVEEPLFDDAFSIGVSAGNDLAKRRSVSLAELQERPWVLPGPGSAYRRHVEALFLAADLSWPADCIVSSSLQLVEAIVSATRRLTVITQLQARMHNFWRMRAIPLRGGGRRTLTVKWRRAGQLSPLAVRLVQLAHQLAADTQQPGRRPGRGHKLQL